MRLLPHEFELITPEYYIIRLEGMRNAEDLAFRQEWERSRWVAMQFLVPYTKKGTKLKPQDLMEFPWEEFKQESITEFVRNRKDLYAKLVP